MIGLIFIIGFAVGERLEYDANFSFLNLGTMTLEVKDTLNYQDVNCYLLSSILTSKSYLKFLFSINDTLYVYTSIDGLLPVLYQERIHESGHHRDNELYFNHNSLSVNYNDTLHLDILENSRDILSFWYYLRTIPLIVGDTIPLNIHSAQENHRVECLVTGEEVIRTPAGEFNTISVIPKTEGGIFGSGGGMEIWYSQKERLPVQIKAKMKFGMVVFKLKGVGY